MGSAWAWPLSETLHFVGLCLLVGVVGTYDLRVLGLAKGIPLAALTRLLPWGVFGFVLCLVTGALFVLGIGANLVGDNAYDVIMRDGYLQLKLLFMGLAGLNLAAFYVTGAARVADTLGPDQDAPIRVKVFAAASLVLWLGVVVFGRLIPLGL
jgi:hypothetical protein